MLRHYYPSMDPMLLNQEQWDAYLECTEDIRQLNRDGGIDPQRQALRLARGCG